MPEKPVHTPPPGYHFMRAAEIDRLHNETEAMRIERDGARAEVEVLLDELGQWRAEGRKIVRRLTEIQDLRNENTRLIARCARAESDEEAARERLAELKKAMKPILAAYNSGTGHISEEQISEAWAAFDA